MLNVILNYLFIFIFDLGVNGAAFATSVAYWIILILSLYNLKSLLLNINWIKHFIWFSWISFSFIPVLIISYFNLIETYLSFFNIIIHVFLMFLMVFLCCYFYKGDEKELIIKNLNKLLSFKF